MIFTNIRLLMYGAAAAAVIGAFTWIYFEGKEEAREECMAKNAEVIQMWEDALTEAEEQNRVLAADLAVYLAKKAEVEAARTQEVIKYVEKDPSSDTVIFDADGLRLLNDAQKGIVTPSE